MMKQYNIAMFMLILSVTPSSAPEVIHHPRVLAAIQDLEQARALRRKAIGGWAPTIEVRTSFGPSDLQDTVNGNKDPKIVDRPGPWSVEVVATQPVLRDTLLTDEMDLADVAIQLRTAQLDEVCAKVSKDDASTVIDLKGSAARREVAKQTTVVLRTVLQQVKQRVNAKDVPETDLLEVQDRLARWELIGLEAGQRQLQAEQRYEQLWAETPGHPKVLAAAAQAQQIGSFDSCTSTNDCADLASQVHPTVLVRKAEAEAALLTVEQRQRLRLPDVRLEAGARHSEQYNSTFIEDELYARVKATVPLPWGLEADADLDSKRAASLAAAHRAMASERDIAGDAALAFVTLQASQAQAKALKSRREIATRTLNAMREAYIAGKKDARSYLDAVEGLAQIGLQAIQLDDAMSAARLELSYVTGALKCAPFPSGDG